jgi:hypothetical protein
MNADKAITVGFRVVPGPRESFQYIGGGFASKSDFEIQSPELLPLLVCEGQHCKSDRNLKTGAKSSASPAYAFVINKEINAISLKKFFKISARNRALFIYILFLFLKCSA